MFSDRITAPNARLDDRRGSWGDAYSARPIGSCLWMLDRARKVGRQPLLLQAMDYCKEGMARLAEDGIAAKVEVQAAWLSRDTLGIAVTVTKPDKTTERFDYARAWTG